MTHQTLTSPAPRIQSASASAPAIQFVFGLHNHQPVGNFDHVFAEAYDKAYHPFLELLEFYPAFRVCLHHTGPLLLWLADNRPKYLERLGALVDRGQVELLGGGFYEPILPIIPEADRIGQIEAMSTWLDMVFGIRPRGIWLAERVWEPTLPRALRAAGIEYTVLDDSHFRSVGIGEEGNLGYWITEDQGDAVAVFPINAQLRYKIPYAEPGDTVQYLRSLSSANLARTAVMADDGEKFGVWPDSHWHCYEQGWMYRFVEQISNNRDWIEMRTFSEVLDTTEPMGRVHLPAASYVEMMEWALPANAQREYGDLVRRLKKDAAFEKDRTYVRGGFWRSFLSKYDESNHIHKKMLRVGAKLQAAPAAFRRTDAFAQAVDHLWRGQCNCAYWHGVFGGLYLTNLRTALYENLIAAESIVDAATRGEGGWCETIATDFDVDGRTELVVETPAQTLVLRPHDGGMLVEHDVRAARFNLLDTLMRRREAYHAQLDGEGGPDDHNYRVKDRTAGSVLAVDWYRRGSFIDHFLGRNATPENFRESSYPEVGDFVAAPYECEWRKGAGETAIVLRRLGIVRTESADIPVEVEKTIVVRADSAECAAHYRIVNRGRETLHARFGIEFNVNLLAADAPDRVHEIDGFRLGVLDRMNSIGEVPDATSFRVKDGWKRLSVDWRVSRPATHWRLPIETVSNSEGGIERIFQSAVVMPVWDLQLAPGAAWDVRVDYGAHAMQ